MKEQSILRFTRKGAPKKRGATTRTYTAEWYPGAPLEKRLGWRHEPDLDERWASMDYDERWRLTVIFEPSVTTTMLCDLPVARTRLRTSQISWMSTGFSGTAM